MAEIVRRFACDPALTQMNPDGVQQDFNSEVFSQALEGFGASLLSLLEDLLGTQELAVTVKYSSEKSDTSALRAVFRGGRAKDSCEDEMSVLNSHVFLRFKEGGQRQQFVHFSDAQSIQVTAGDSVPPEAAKSNKAYRDYAESCDFRSVLAFPLRAPINKTGVGVLKQNSIRGFLSLDSPYPGVFKKIVPGEGDELKHLFFGLADSLAILAILTDRGHSAVSSGTGGRETDK